MNDELDYARKILAFVDILPKLVSLYIFLSILPKVPDITEVLIEYNTAKPQKISTDRVWYNGKLCYRYELPSNSVSSGGGKYCQETKIHNLPSGWPVKGKITSKFGPRIHPVTRKGGNHNGIDIRVKIGTPVRVTANGIVSFAGWQSGGMGYAVVVDHENRFSTRQGHLSRTMVKKGEKVEKGQIIAYSGNSGKSTGPHLYYEIKQNGKAVDPTPYLKEGISVTAKKPEQTILVSSENQ